MSQEIVTMSKKRKFIFNFNPSSQTDWPALKKQSNFHFLCTENVNKKISLHKSM